MLSWNNSLQGMERSTGMSGALCVMILCIVLIGLFVDRDRSLDAAKAEAQGVANTLVGNLEDRLDSAAFVLFESVRLAQQSPMPQNTLSSIAPPSQQIDFVTSINPWIDRLEVDRAGQRLLVAQKRDSLGPGWIARGEAIPLTDVISVFRPVRTSPGKLYLPVSYRPDDGSGIVGTADAEARAMIDISDIGEIVRGSISNAMPITAVIHQQSGQPILAYPFDLAGNRPSQGARLERYFRIPYARSNGPFKILPAENYIGASSEQWEWGYSVAVALPKDALMSAWTRRALVSTSLALVACSIILLFSLRNQDADRRNGNGIGYHPNSANPLSQLGEKLIPRARETTANPPATGGEDERFRALVEASQEAIEIIDLESRILYTNPARARMFDDVSETLGRMPLEQRLTRDSRKMWHDEMLPALERGESWEGFLDARATDGQFITLRMHADLVDRPEVGTPVILCLMRDATDERVLKEGLQREKARAEAANKAKSDFLAAMSHELRTPLNAILGFGQLLQLNMDGKLAPKQADHVGQIMTAGRNLLRLIDDILDMSKIEAGQIDIRLEKAKVNRLLEDGISVLRPMAEKFGVNLSIRNETDPAEAVLVDPARFQQVFANLGTNAIKYNRPNDPKLTIHVQRVNGNVRFSFIDTGIGIPNDRLDKLFEPFERLGVEKTNIEGTGIGLAITRKLVEVMNGDLQVVSRAGQGSHFWFDIPRAEAENIGSTSSKSADIVRISQAQASGHADKTRILYIEDNASNQRLVCDWMEDHAEYAIMTATTAETGIELARRERPNIVLMDVGLPGISGIEAMTAWKRDPILSTIPVIGLSAAARAEDIATGRAAGFADYITKPFDMDTLLTAIKTIHTGAQTQIRRGQS